MVTKRWLNADLMLTKSCQYSPKNEKFVDVTQNHMQNIKNMDNCMRHFSHLQNCLTGYLKVFVTGRKKSFLNFSSKLFRPRSHDLFWFVYDDVKIQTHLWVVIVNRCSNHFWVSHRKFVLSQKSRKTNINSNFSSQEGPESIVQILVYQHIVKVHRTGGPLGGPACARTLWISNILFNF